MCHLVIQVLVYKLFSSLFRLLINYYFTWQIAIYFVTYLLVTVCIVTICSLVRCHTTWCVLAGSKTSTGTCCSTMSGSMPSCPHVPCRQYSVTLKMHATILRTGRPPGEYDALLHVNLEFWKVLHC